MRKKNRKKEEGERRRGFLFSSRSFFNPFFRSRYNFLNKNARKHLLRRIDAYTETSTLHKNGSKEWGDILVLPNNLSLENLAAAQKLSPTIKILEKKIL